MAERKKVLIVEDESIFAISLELHIEEAGFASAGLCATGEDAVEQARAERPDLVLMDMRLAGEMSGLEAAKIIAGELAVPIVIISGYTERLVIEHSQDYQPDLILSKPVDLAQIDEVLRRFLS